MTEKKVDIYRDTPIRYLGYANEVGEAFRAFIGSRWVLATYGVATTYVLADTFDKTSQVYKEQQNSSERASKSVYAAADTLTWQMLASVVIPGFTINRVCALSTYVIRRSTSLPKSRSKMIVTAIGLSTIPFIIKPIDHFTDRLLDNTIRRLAP